MTYRASRDDSWQLRSDDRLHAHPRAGLRPNSALTQPGTAAFPPLTNPTTPCPLLIIPEPVRPSTSVARSPYKPSGPLPTLTSLSPPVLASLLLTASPEKARWLLSKDTAQAHRTFQKSAQTGGTDGTTFTLFSGRLYTRGINVFGQCGGGTVSAWEAGDRRVKVPATRFICTGYGSVFAQTTGGLFSWGSNASGKLGNFCQMDETATPTRVAIAHSGTVERIFCLDEVTFFCSRLGWSAAGSNTHGQLGLDTIEEFLTMPTPMSMPSPPTRWTSNWGSSFAWTRDGIYACGNNGKAQLGVDDGDEAIRTPNRVLLSKEVASTVTKIVTSHESTFFLTTNRQCIVVGSNKAHSLGIEDGNPVIEDPVALPFPVDDVITRAFSTLFRSGDKVLVCGTNEVGQFPVGPFEVIKPVEMPVPFPIESVTLGHDSVFVKERGGEGRWAIRNSQTYNKDAPRAWHLLGPPGILRVWSAHHTAYLLREDGVYRQAEGGSAERIEEVTFIPLDTPMMMMM